MKQTENYGFNLPEENDYFDITDFNENMQAVDRELKSRQEEEEQFVRKESGMQLSSNDYTTEEKEKLAGISSGAEMNQKLAAKSDKNHTHNSLGYLTLGGLNLPNRGESGGIQFGVYEDERHGYKDFNFPRIYTNTEKELHFGIYSHTSFDQHNFPFDCEIILSGCSGNIATKYRMKYETMRLNLEVADLIYSGSLTHDSDEHIKKNISSLSDDRYLSFFDKINLSRYQFKGNNPGLTEPPHSRYHIGVIAQELQDTISECGIDDMEFSAVKAQFFIPNTSENRITGGWRTPKEGYDYSENVYNYKHDREYEFYNEVIEKKISDLTFDDYRENIQYIMFEDNAKVERAHKQPPIRVRSIHLVDKEGNLTALPLDLGGLPYYEQEDLDEENPLSSGTYEGGLLTIKYDKMYGAYLLKISENGIRLKDYESVIFDVDFIGEYKIYFLPSCEMKNANVWDRKRNPKLIYDYSVDYEQLYLTAMYALQETRKDFVQYKKEMSEALENMEKRIEKMEGDK